MTTVGDVIRITSCKELLNEEICNVYFYLVGLWTGNLSIADLLQEWVVSENTALAPISSLSMTWQTVRWENITDGAESELITPALPTTGSATGEALPTHVAASFKLNRTTPITRNGYKRFGGLVESLSNGNNNLIGATEQAAIELWLQNVWDSTATDELEPVIVGRDAFGAPDLTRVNLVSSAQMDDVITSQVSRRP